MKSFVAKETVLCRGGGGGCFDLGEEEMLTF